MPCSKSAPQVGPESVWELADASFCVQIVEYIWSICLSGALLAIAMVWCPIGPRIS